MKHPSRRSFVRLALAAAVHALARRVEAADVSVPITIQSELLAKIAAFDRGFLPRSGSSARVLVAHLAGGDSARIARQMTGALNAMSDIAGLPKTVEMLEWTSAAALSTIVRSRRTSLIYLSIGLETEAAGIAAALAGTDVLSIGATGTIAERGACVGFELEEGKPKIYVNLRAAKAQKVDFRAQLLRLVKLV